jgi:hypothetical protein
MRGPVMRMAPNPMRLTVRSPPIVMGPAAEAVGDADPGVVVPFVEDTSARVYEVAVARATPARVRGTTRSGGEARFHARQRTKERTFCADPPANMAEGGPGPV